MLASSVMMLRWVVVAAAFSILSAGAASAQEEVVYLGPHPPHPAAGGRFCEVADRHAHDYVPVDPVEFLRTRGVWVFLGDPTRHGYEGATWSYAGPHPLPSWLGGARCDRRAWHAHHFRGDGVAEPPPATEPPVYVPPYAWAPLAPVVVVVPLHVAPRRRPPPPPHAFETRPPPVAPRKPEARPPATSSVPSARTAPPPPMQPRPDADRHRKRPSR